MSAPTAEQWMNPSGSPEKWFHSASKYDEQFTGAFDTIQECVADAQETYRPGDKYSVAIGQLVYLMPSQVAESIFDNLNEDYEELSWIGEPLENRWCVTAVQKADLNERINRVFAEWISENKFRALYNCTHDHFRVVPLDEDHS